MKNRFFKRILCIILNVLLIITSISVAAEAAVADNTETDLTVFAQKLVSVIRSYDKSDSFTDDGEVEPEGQNMLDISHFASSVNAEFEQNGGTAEISTDEKTAVFENESNNITVKFKDGKTEILTADEKSQITGDKSLVSASGAVNALQFKSEKNSNTLKVKYPFASRRLIVKTKAETIDERGAAECISGYNDLFILQYNSVTETAAAYDYYCSLDSVIYVEPDYIRFMQADEEGSAGLIPASAPEKTDRASLYKTREAALSWVSEKIGFEDIKDTLAEKLLGPVTVAVIDSGVQTDHEFLSDRLLPNNLNLSTSGNPNSIEDDYGHGTHVSGIIADNTLNNVKIKPYKVLNNEGKGESSLIAIAVDKAVSDGVDVINMSLSGEGESRVLTDAVNNAAANGINVVVAAGNKSQNLDNVYYSPACIDSAITVSSINIAGGLSRFSNYGSNIDIAAYGEGINSSYLNNTYTLMSGTSMAAPLVSSGAAILKSFFPKMTAAKIEERIKKYSIKQYNDTNHLFGSGFLYLKYILQELPKAPDPVFSTTKENFSQTFNLRLTCPEADSKIYYILNSKEAFPQVGVINGTEYTAPLKITTDTRVSAIAFVKGKLLSSVVTYNFKRVLDNEDAKYDIDNNGKILGYYGKDTELVIPDTIKGITVKSLAYAVFQNNNTLKTVTFPDTVTQISPMAFMGCTSLESVYGNCITSVLSDAFSNSTIKSFPWSKLESVGTRSFMGCSNLENIDLSNVKKIEASGFENVKCDIRVDSDKLETIDTYAFRNSNISSLNAPNLNTAYMQSFENCVLLESFSAPRLSVTSYKTFLNCTKLKSYDFPQLKTIGIGCFENTPIKKANFPQALSVGNEAFKNCTVLKTAVLPNAAALGNNAFDGCEKLKFVNLSGLKSVQSETFNGCKALNCLYLPSVTVVAKSAFDGSFIKNIILDKATDIQSLPKTLQWAMLPSTLQKYGNLPQNTDCSILGTAGTKAYSLAQDYNYKFHNIPYLYNELPAQYYPESGKLTVDCIGYLLTYQWYKTNENKNTGGELIQGACEKSYKPSFSDNAKYYYCIVTSNDNGVKSTFVTNVIENSKTLITADYTEYNKAVEKAVLLIKDNYIDFSAVTSALAVDVSGKNITEQDEVDEQTDAILTAINNLVFKGADYTEYNKAVEKADLLIKDNYVDFSAVDSALAVDVSGKNITEQDEVDEQTNDILTAITALELKPADNSQLEALIASVPDDLSVYTDETVKNLNAVLASICLGKDITEQEAVNKQFVKLTLAMSELEYKKADYEKITETLNEIPDDLSLYTPETVGKLKELLNKIDYNKNITQQNELDLLNEDIRTAVNSLELLSVKEEAFDQSTEQNTNTENEQNILALIPKTGKTKNALAAAQLLIIAAAAMLLSKRKRRA